MATDVDDAALAGEAEAARREHRELRQVYAAALRRQRALVARVLAALRIGPQ